MSSDPRADLTELVRAARAWVEWLRASGVDVLPTEQPPQDQLDRLAGLAPARGRATKTAARPQPKPPAAQAPRPAPTRAALPDPPAARAAPAVAAGPAIAAGPAVAASLAATGSDARPRVPREERDRRLAVLAEEVKSCTKCRLHESRTNTAFSRGSADAELVFVGEAPGFEEDRQGLPFVGPAGQLLDKMIVAMGYARDDVYICNATKCRPPNNRKPELDEMEACAPYLKEQLDLVDPKVMVALGATGVQALIGVTLGITRLRGTWRLYRGRVPLMPTFHPAYLLRSPEKKRDVWEDLKQVMQRLGKEPPKPAPKGPQRPA